MAKSKPPAAPQVPPPPVATAAVSDGTPATVSTELATGPAAPPLLADAESTEVAALDALPEPLRSALATPPDEPARLVPAPTVGRVVLAFGFDPDNTDADAAPFPAVIVRVVDAAATPPVVGVFVMAAPAKVNGANNTGYYEVPLHPAGEAPKTGPGSGRHAEWMHYQQAAAASAAK